MEIQIPNQLVNDFLNKQPLIAGVDAIELSYLVDVAEKVVFGPGELIFTEGENSNDLYFIFDGKVNILKIDPTTKEEHLLGTLKTEDSFGDLAFLDDQPRSSSVRALTETTVLKISKETTYSQSSEMTNIYNKIMKNIAKIIINRLRDTNETFIQNIGDKVNHLQKLIDSGKLFITAVLLFWAAKLLTTKIDNPFLQNWIQVISVTGVLSFILFKFQEYPYHFFGISNSWSSLKHPLWVASAFSALTAITYFTGKVIQFIYPNLHWIHFTMPTMNFFLLSYPFFAFFKEFISRGIIQTSLKEFLKDDKGLLAILYTSAILGLLSLPFGVGWSIMTFAFNYLLGYIYNKNPNLLSITIIHAVLGILLMIWNFIPQNMLFNF